MSDNGFMHGEHRAPAEKVLPYERVDPRPAGHARPRRARGRLDRRLVANVDVPPTILDATECSGPRAGRALAARAARRPGAEWGRDILIENGDGANGVPAYRGIRTYRFLYVEHTTGEHELYDLDERPVRDAAALDGFARYAKVQREPRVAAARARRCAGVDCLAARTSRSWCARAGAA